MPNLWTYVAAALFAFLIGAYGGYQVEAWADGSQIAALKESAAREAAAAESLARKDQAARDAISQAVAVREAASRQRIVEHTKIVTKEIAAHVPSDSHCITFGLVRVLNDAARQTDAASLSPPAGEPDGACAPVSWDRLASDIADDYAAGTQNAERLNGLQAWVRAQEAQKAPQ